MAITKYVVIPESKVCYSDTNILAEDVIGLNPKDPANVAYTKYNKPYGQFQHLGGINLKIDPSLPTNAGQVLDFIFENITTNNSANTYVHNRQIIDSRPLKVFVGMKDMNKLNDGSIECYGSVTDQAKGTVYIISPKTFTIQSP
ncbi:hypothetical protein I5P86_01330 [Pseudomonas glycinae]|uniref:hypothetical protein n=1 Tax=Pseudomonas TaxID=286 RepID=UPI0018D6FE83|nr:MULTISPECIES: hypothetical protein [Pseudomonas]MBH3403685.1 hypothetical protein [Pseudomonas glycinae]MDI3401300.1 hypothetical protein [Pseudomonas sp. V88_4]